jgi:hypothetical protein
MNARSPTWHKNAHAHPFSPEGDPARVPIIHQSLGSSRVTEQTVSQDLLTGSLRFLIPPSGIRNDMLKLPCFFGSFSRNLPPVRMMRRALREPALRKFNRRSSLLPEIGRRKKSRIVRGRSLLDDFSFFVWSFSRNLPPVRRMGRAYRELSGRKSIPRSGPSPETGRIERILTPASKSFQETG